MKRYKGYLLTVLMIVLAFNSVDRLALGLVLQGLKVDLALSDVQLGLLSGIAFALFYSVMGVPIARWADRGNRVTIMSLAIALWSVGVAACGLAGSFIQLLLIRVAVAVGEAGCIPPAHSLIADVFRRAERPRAVARFMVGSPLSGLIGFFLAGWLNQLYGWRITFVLLGLPGLALAMLVWLTLKEPRSNVSSPHAAAPFAQPSSDRENTISLSAPSTLREVCGTLWANTTFRHLLFGFSVIHFFGAGIANWQPAFFIRSYGIHTGELGAWFALIYGLGGILGTYWGGELASRRAPDDEPLQLRAIAVLYVSFGIISGGVYLLPGPYLALGLVGLGVVGLSTVTAPLFATIQTLVPDRMRAVSIALIYLFANLIGMGLGPLIAGALSDALRPMFGEESLRYALLSLCPGYFWAAWHLWRGSKTVAQDLNVARLDRELAIQGQKGDGSSALGRTSAGEHLPSPN